MEAKKLHPHDHRHGTVNAYCNYGCRCDACRKAQADYMREKYRRMCRTDGCPNLVWTHRKGYSGLCIECASKDKVKPIVHGTETGYTKGCRCLACRKASAEERRFRRWRAAHA